MTAIVVVEEHHEALYAWKRMQARGQWRGSNALLIHVDHHADMQLPACATPLREISSNPENLLSLIRTHLSIESFIMAGVFCRLFSNVCWVSPHPIQSESPRTRFVASAGPDDDMIISGSYGKNVKNRVGSDCVTFTLYDSSYLPTTSGQPVLLDIDLDYFSCASFPQPAHCRVELTEQGATDFQDDHYHPLRLHFGPAARVMVVDGRYYLSIHEGPPEPLPNPTSLDEALKAVESFVSSLGQKDIVPTLVTVARSRLSGHTPADQWEQIENCLLNGLKELYSPQLLSLEDV